MRATDLPPNERSILITGCSSGIGEHCALALAKKGYRVFATARDSEDVVRLQQAGLTALQLDVRDTQSIRSALEQILAQTDQRLFALFNNAGYAQPGAVEDLTRTLLRQQFETNLFGAMELTNLVLPIMRRQGYGRIIQNSSVLGIIQLPFRGAYNATKHALEAITDTLRLEVGAGPIKICSIEPGPIKSRFRTNAYQQFLEHIDTQNSPYAEVYELLSKRLANDTTEPPFTLGPEAVEKALLHALCAQNPQSHYYVTFPTHMFAFLKRCLPSAWLDKILLRAAGEEGKQLKNLRGKPQ